MYDIIISPKKGCTKNLLDDNDWLLRLCDNGDGECKTCIGSNCNSQSSFRRCTYCNTREDGDCMNIPIKSFEKVCKQYDDECFTRISKFEVSRGCLNEQSAEFIDDCRGNPDKCGICKVDNEIICNNKPIKMHMCNECFTGNGDDDCLTEPDKYRDKICSGMNTIEDEGCYFHKVRSIKI